MVLDVCIANQSTLGSFCAQMFGECDSFLLPNNGTLFATILSSLSDNMVDEGDGHSAPGNK